MKRKEIYPKNHLNMRVISKILIVSISLLFASKIALADQNDPRLNNLFKKLNETENQDEIRDLISDIWNIWYEVDDPKVIEYFDCLLYTSPSPRDRTRSRMPSSA